MGLKGVDYHSPGDVVHFVNNAVDVTAAVIDAGNEGVDYEVDDLLHVVGGEGEEPAIVQVDSVDGTGAITGSSLYNEGAYLAAPSNPVSVYGGKGSGAKFNLTTAQAITGPADIVRILNKDGRWYVEYVT